MVGLSMKMFRKELLETIYSISIEFPVHSRLFLLSEVEKLPDGLQGDGRMWKCHLRVFQDLRPPGHVGYSNHRSRVKDLGFNDESLSLGISMEGAQGSELRSPDARKSTSSSGKKTLL